MPFSASADSPSPSHPSSDPPPIDSVGPDRVHKNLKIKNPPNYPPSPDGLQTATNHYNPEEVPPPSSDPIPPDPAIPTPPPPLPPDLPPVAHAIITMRKNFPPLSEEQLNAIELLVL